MINKSDSRCAVVRFCYHSYDYRSNWPPLSPITITYCYSLGSTLLGVLYKDLHRMFATTSSEEDTLDISRFVSSAGGGEGNTIRVEALTFLLGTFRF